jgi:hypothetical protein
MGKKSFEIVPNFSGCVATPFFDTKCSTIFPLENGFLQAQNHF